MDAKLPVVIVVEGVSSRLEAISSAITSFDYGRLGREFELIGLDCFESLRDWHVRNLDRFVSAVVIGVDFTGVEDERKLVGYPELNYPVPRDFNAREFQGLIIYALMRETGIDPIVPVLLLSRDADDERMRRFHHFMLYPAQGLCHLVSVPPDRADLEPLAERVDAFAMRLLDEKRRAEWRAKHRMVVGRSRRMVFLAHEIERLGPADSVVLILGQPGVGKELVANALHRCSLRCVPDDPVRGLPCAVNIAALDRNLIESELFGHVRGAFTGSTGDREGVFEYGNGSTVFIDEIGDISPEVQLKLLRTIENRRIRRVGSSSEIPVDMRVIAATNRTIDELVVSFRPDFYSRVVQQCLPVPSLIDRWQDETPAVVESDVREFFSFVAAERNASPRRPRPIEVDEGAARFVHQLVGEYISGDNDVFRGNFRTLRALLEQAWERAQYDGSAAVSVGHVISTIGVMRFLGQRAPRPERRQTLEGLVGSLSIKAIEKHAIIEALERSGNNITRAAEMMSLHRDTLRRRIAEYGI
ncbi:MAG: sigma 54-interacting transcriptional regulator [bacterium]